MLLGACLDAGVPLDGLEEVVAALELSEVSLSCEKVQRSGIAGSKCHVTIEETSRAARLPEILERIDSAGLSPAVTSASRRVFQRLGEAEAEVHGTVVEQVHFHEVGAADAIVDIVGGVWCLEYLGVSGVRLSQFTLGGGWTESVHGRLPVPPPAVMSLVAGWPVSEGPIEAELTTPTGAAIATTIADGVGLPVDFVPEKVGYGAGNYDFAEQPNLLRLVLGQAAQATEQLVVVECEIDDMSLNLFEPLAEALFGAGARDVHWVPIQMKKMRPAISVRVLAPRSALGEIGETLFRETPTLGYRYWSVGRETLAREQIEVDTSLGRVGVKKVRRRDGSWELRPEYEACRVLAAARGESVRDVFRTLVAELTLRNSE